MGGWIDVGTVLANHCVESGMKRGCVKAVFLSAIWEMSVWICGGRHRSLAEAVPYWRIGAESMSKIHFFLAGDDSIGPG